MAKYVLSIFELFDKNWSYDSVWSYIKTGFIDQNTMDAIITSKPQDKDKSKNYFAKGVFAIYYIHNLKGISTLEAGTIKGYKAAIETVDIIYYSNYNDFELFYNERPC